MDYVAGRLDRSRSQVYQAITVVDKLSPHVTDDQLESMGITKASDLLRIMKQTGRAPSKEIISRATDAKVTSQVLENEIYEKYHVRKDYETGRLRCIERFYATDDEWAEILRAFDIAARTDPVISKNTPSGVRMRMIMTRMAQEYLSTHEAEVNHAESMG